MEKIQYKKKEFKTIRKNDMLLDIGKLPPQSIEAEEAVLGAVLIESGVLHQIAEMFNPDIFYVDKHKMIAESILSLRSRIEPIDILTITQELKKTSNLDAVGGAYYIVTLTNRVASTANTEFHCRILMQCFLKRRIIAEATKMITAAYDNTTDVFDVIDISEKAITSISNKIISDKIDKVSTIYNDFLVRNESIIKHKNGMSGVPSGFSEIDRLTGGWQNSELTIVAARPSMGKTALVLCYARNAAVMFNMPVVIFSIEMSKTILWARLMAQESGTHAKKYTRYGLNEQALIENELSCRNLINANIYIDDTPAITLFQLRNKARRLKREKGIRAIYIDYLQLIETDEENRYVKITAISNGLKQLARELEIPVIALSQLSRAVEGRGGSKEPTLSDLRESGAIEQDADIVQFIYRPEYYGIKEDSQGNSTQGKAAIITAKHRNGALDTNMLEFENKTTKFFEEIKEELPTINSIHVSHPDNFTESNKEEEHPF